MSNPTDDAADQTRLHLGEGRPRTEANSDFSKFTIKTPQLVSVTYTAVYDTGEMVVGAATHDGGDEPMHMIFEHARGRSTPLS